MHNWLPEITFAASFARRNWGKTHPKQFEISSRLVVLVDLVFPFQVSSDILTYPSSNNQFTVWKTGPKPIRNLLTLQANVSFCPLNRGRTDPPLEVK